MADLATIWNMALGHVGDDVASIVDPETDQSEAARYCRAFWPATRDAALRAHPWNCATFLATLPAFGDPPVFGYLRRYALPNDPYCLRVLRLDEARHGETPEWKLRGRFVETDEPAPLHVHYIGRVTDPTQLDPLLVDYLAVRLARVLVGKLAGSVRAGDVLRKLEKELLAEARAMDGQEGSADELYEDGFLAARW